MKRTLLSTLSTVAALALPLTVQAGTDGPAKRDGFAGYDHPNEFLVKPHTIIAENMMPVMVHPDQDKVAQTRLEAYKKRTGRSPNIVIFLLDDVGWMDVGFNGGGGAVGNPTPDIDAVAGQGLILTSAYSQPSSSPSRATILTGQYPVHHGILRPSFYGEPGGLEGFATLAKLLRDQGYTTQAIGKWHLGENTGSQPQNAGFDDFRGFLGVSDIYTEWRDAHFNPEVALSPERYAYMDRLNFSKCDVHATRGGELENIAVITPEYIKDLDQRWLQYGVDFIKRQTGSKKPFFLYYATRGCHFDNYPNEKYAGRSPARTPYSDSMVEMNDVFATLYKTLEETGQLDDTLIIFTSDNGPEAEVPPHGRTPFRGAKGSTWEGGVRVPTFVYWKGMIEPRRSDGLFDLADLFNTCLSVAGKPGAQVSTLVPSGTFIDGVDQTSFLLAPQGQSNRKSIFYFWLEQLAAVRVDEFKYHILVQLPFSVTQTGHQGGFTGTVSRTAGSLVFNLYTNPQEDDSVAIRHIPMYVPLMQEVGFYRQIMKKYPARRQVGMN